MKRGYIAKFIKTLFVIVIIVAIIFGIVYFIKNKYDDEQYETIKTNMLLIEAQTQLVAEKVIMEEEDAKYIGIQIEELSEDEIIKNLKEKGIIDVENEDNIYYVLEQSHLIELGLDTIELDNGYYIVEYNSNEIIFSKNTNTIYVLSEMEELEAENEEVETTEGIEETGENENDVEQAEEESEQE